MTLATMRTALVALALLSVTFASAPAGAQTAQAALSYDAGTSELVGLAVADGADFSGADYISNLVFTVRVPTAAGVTAGSITSAFCPFTTTAVNTATGTSDSAEPSDFIEVVLDNTNPGQCDLSGFTGSSQIELFRLSITGADGGEMASVASSTEAFATSGLTGDNFYFETNASTNSTSAANDGIAPGQGTATLPVELVSIAAAADGREVVLTWETASERNNAGFTVELARVGAPGQPVVYTEAGFVPGAGTTDEPQRYAFRTDGLDYGTYTLRLKQVDYDGVSAYSGQVEAALTMAERFVLDAVYPNPVSRTAHVAFASRDGEQVRVSVYDVLGRQVAVLYDGTTQASEMVRTTMDVSGLASGTYVLRLEAEALTATARLTVIH